MGHLSTNIAGGFSHHMLQDIGTLTIFSEKKIE